MVRLGEFVFVSGHSALEQRFGAAAQIAGAHRRGEGQSAHPAEGLHLKRADERDQRVDREVEVAVGNEHHRRQAEQLQRDHQLVPADPAERGQFAMDEFGGEDPERIEQDRQQIAAALPPLQLGQTVAEKHHIAGYGIGEHLAPVQISVDIQKTADDAQQAGRGQPLGVDGGGVHESFLSANAILYRLERKSSNPAAMVAARQACSGMVSEDRDARGK
ncbi:hypothetical protein SDC9_147781 [bioreactor metagenome]|uniref:Uncharacterized protein n=1 Tax=bioreactor metagenome TaxID=1076179 RepID=A0A645EEW2_9ZZZZ